MRRNVQILLIILLVLLTSGVNASESFSRPVVISATVASVSETEDAVLAEVILDAVVLQLRLEGFEIQTIMGDSWPPDAKEQDFLLKSEYQITGNTISINIRSSASGSKSEESIADGSWSGPLSITLDDEIQKIIHNEIAPFLPRSIEVSRKDTEKAAAAGTAWVVAAIGVSQTESKQEDSTTLNAANRKKPFQFDIGGILTVPLSDTATYARLGYGGQISFGYAIPAGSIFIVPRVVIGGIWLPTEAPIPTDIFVFPFGLDLKISSGSNQPMLPYLHIGGGGSWFMVIPEGSPTQGKIVPYADAGLGIDFRFGPAFGIYADVFFRAMFEGSLILYGIYPGVGTSLRF
ncbi:MAG: hypothetical protein DRZ90_13575 [Spirochaetes bacterium]|nr:MAG: hypothetical protein DRZ90_13575 [Spirochaetota bacterium]